MNPYHHGDLRAALLARARTAIEADDAPGLSLRALATAVGVSPNAPYRHFAGKEDLLAALSAQGFADLTARFTPFERTPGVARLEGCMAGYLQFARDNPGLYRLMFGRDLDPLSCDPVLGVAATACFAALVALTAGALELSADDQHLAKSAAVVWSLSHGAALLEIDKTTSFLAADQRPTATDLARVLIAGFKIRP